MQFERDARVGPWTLKRPLGSGGNAEVWLAERDGEEARALKVLLDRRPAAVTYQRFRREIETHRAIGTRADVLPMLDWNLPETPTKRDRAWMSMPVAVPVRDALAGTPLERVVEAVASFAATLVALTTGFGIAHRDIKPGNLYRFGESWAVGDLGLIDVPGAESLTEPDRIVGPANYVAYEMMVSADTADAHKADVYSLAKTLWVLATGQTWPPPGHQPAALPLQAIAAYRAHPRTAELDRLIDWATRDPSARPSMEAVVEELNAWLAPRAMTDPTDLNLDDIAARIRTRFAPVIAAEDRAADVRVAAEETVQQFLDAMQSLVEAAEAALPRSDLNPADILTENLLLPSRAMGRAQVESYWHTGVHAVGPGHRSMAFRLMAAVALLDNDEMHIAGAYLVAPERVMGSAFSKRYGPWTSIPGSLAAAEAVGGMVEAMCGDLEAALTAFAESL